MSKRINKTPDKWTDEELRAWANNKAQAVRGITPANVADVAVERFGLGEDLSVEEVKAQVLATQEEVEEAPTEEPVAETAEESTEAPVEERNKDVPASKTPVAPVPEVLSPDSPVKEVHVEKRAEQPAPVAPTVKTRKEEPAKPVFVPSEPQGEKSVSRAIFDDQIQRYMEGMRPGKPVNARDGAKLQKILFNTIQVALNQTGSDFSAFYGELLRLVKEHRNGLFHERYVFRFMDTVQVVPAERRNFERMLNLMLTTCDPATRAHSLKQVDLPASINGLPQAQQQKLTEFYSGM